LYQSKDPFQDQTCGWKHILETPRNKFSSGFLVKATESTSATYVLGKEQSERAAGNKDIILKFKHIKYLLSYKTLISLSPIKEIK
jgi:hypothetical protein